MLIYFNAGSTNLNGEPGTHMIIQEWNNTLKTKSLAVIVAYADMQKHLSTLGECADLENADVYKLQELILARMTNLHAALEDLMEH